MITGPVEAMQDRRERKKNNVQGGQIMKKGEALERRNSREYRKNNK